MKITQKINNENNPLGNYNEFIIVHHTGSTAKEDNQINYLNKNDYVSCHFIIKKDGEIIQLMNADRIAYHCGYSEWMNFGKKSHQLIDPISGKKFSIRGMNPYSLGIEIISDGKIFTEKQVKSCEKLCCFLAIKFNISTCKILRHADIAPKRKVDVGENFFKKFGTWENFQKKIEFRKQKVQDNFDVISEKIEVKYI